MRYFMRVHSRSCRVKWRGNVGEDGNAVTSTDAVVVDIEDVVALRHAVKEKFTDSHLAGIAASDLTVFANRAEYDAKRSVLLPQSGSPVTAYGNNEENALIVQVPTQRQVVVPTVSQQSFVWKEPKPLVGTTGATWDFQNSLDLGNLASAIGCHYEAWRDGKTDKRSHPLFVCLDGPGTGKSRLLDEFPNVLQQQIFCDETQGDPAMKQLLRNAYNFKITFENGTTKPGNFIDPGQAIGTRMLYQLQDSVVWDEFMLDHANHVVPAQVLSKLSAITGTDPSQMCVILCVDSLQKLPHEAGSKRSEFYTAFASLCDLVNASKCLLIVICAATIYQPVDEFLAASPQWREMLQTTSLERPKIDGRDVFDAFNNGNKTLTQLLVDDMGGHGRALEELFKVMLQSQGQAFEFIPVMHKVLAAIRQAYPAIVAQMQNGSPSGDAFLCLEDATKGFFHEVHQCKCVEGNLSLDVFEQERLKAAGPDDLFILYCTSLVTADLCLLPNSAFVDATCWEAYYGPFAARAFFIKYVPLPCINTSSEVQLEFVEGVGPAYRARIAKKRPFTSLEDAFVKTKIPVKVLRRFKFNTDSR
ncbi:hypothetical protein PInf_011773 [Phytophthora infestans]|nr:hypothetical protein PInf_011773 [Phytophthora infestans]